MKIALKKIKAVDVLLIQNEVLKFMNYKYATIDYKDYDKCCEDIIAIELLEVIYKQLRSKLETGKSLLNINLTLSQSVILQYCCRTNLIVRNEETKQLMQNISSQLHEKHINI